MKKIYFNPEMEVVKMQTMTVLAASETMEKSGETNEVQSSGFFGSDNEDW